LPTEEPAEWRRVVVDWPVLGADVTEHDEERGAPLPFVFSGLFFFFLLSSDLWRRDATSCDRSRRCCCGSFSRATGGKTDRRRRARSRPAPRPPAAPRARPRARPQPPPRAERRLQPRRPRPVTGAASRPAVGSCRTGARRRPASDRRRRCSAPPSAGGSRRRVTCPIATGRGFCFFFRCPLLFVSRVLPETRKTWNIYKARFG